MAIVANQDGGLVPCPGGPDRLADGTEAIRALSFADVDEIIGLFDRVHPYDREAVPGSLLELEAENYGTGERRQLWCLATSAKRYVLWNQTEHDMDIRKASEHGLGHLLDPTGQGSRTFSEAAWRIVLAKHLDIKAPDPEWLDRLAVSRLVASTPYLLNLFKNYNQGKDYTDQVKPFGFMLTATPQRIAGILLGVERLHLIAPYETDPTKWENMDWTDIYTRKQHRVSATINAADPNTVPAQTLHDVIEAWATNPELKSLGPDGQPCARDTRGLLQRRPVKTTHPQVTFIGKESNHLEEAQAGIMGRDEILNEYPDPERDPWQQLVLPAIDLLGASVVAQRAGVDRRTVERALQGTRPRLQSRTRVLAAVRQMIIEHDHGNRRGRQTDQMLVAFLQKTPVRACDECGSSLAGRRRDTRFCSDRCRMRYRRRSHGDTTDRNG
jgi:predicted nucleic acid-binding Zn ribbon protein